MKSGSGMSAAARPKFNRPDRTDCSATSRDCWVIGSSMRAPAPRRRTPPAIPTRLRCATARPGCPRPWRRSRPVCSPCLPPGSRAPAPRFKAPPSPTAYPPRLLPMGHAPGIRQRNSDASPRQRNLIRRLEPCPDRLDARSPILLPGRGRQRPRSELWRGIELSVTRCVQRHRPAGEHPAPS